MDAAAFEQVTLAYRGFHAFCTPHFGRRKTQDQSRHYLQALLVQPQDRRNAKKSLRIGGRICQAMQRFLTAVPGMTTR